jgi:hypothetical protein
MLAGYPLTAAKQSPLSAQESNNKLLYNSCLDNLENSNSIPHKKNGSLQLHGTDAWRSTSRIAIPGRNSLCRKILVQPGTRLPHIFTNSLGEWNHPPCWRPYPRNALLHHSSHQERGINRFLAGTEKPISTTRMISSKLAHLYKGVAPINWFLDSSIRISVLADWVLPLCCEGDKHSYLGSFASHFKLGCSSRLRLRCDRCR